MLSWSPCWHCSILVDRPKLVSGLDVLEIGAGTGLCGIVAAKLGASQVLFTMRFFRIIGPAKHQLACVQVSHMQQQEELETQSGG
jgi:predicted nicotinamide N-methyase